jgi:hypothetical protein
MFAKGLTKHTTLPHILNPDPSVLIAPPFRTIDVGEVLCLAVLFGRDVSLASVVVYDSAVAPGPESANDFQASADDNTLDVVV